MSTKNPRIQQVIVTHKNFDLCLLELEKAKYKSFDTETTGLYPYHGDRAFCATFSTHDKDFYFNFQEYEGLTPSLVLPRSKILEMQPIFNSGNIIIQNAKFDMHFFGIEGIKYKARIFCTKVFERLVNNERFSYKLEAIGKRIGYEKDDAVMNYIKKHNLYDLRKRAGKEWKQPMFYKVPYKIISEYAMRDSRVCYEAFMDQLKSLKQMERHLGKSVYDVCTNESELLKTVYEVERVGVKLDVPYAKNGLDVAQYSVERKLAEFRKLTGERFVDSAICFTKVFKKTDFERFKRSDKDNYEFNKTILKTFKSPAAKLVLDIRKLNVQIQSLKQFLFAADEDGIIHTDYDPAGTRTGRFSSKNPNLQNLKKDVDARGDDLVIRRAFIPRKGYKFVMIDYDQMEYRMMLDIAGAKGLINKVLGGLCVHSATGEIAGIERAPAKTVNFGTLYGQGIKSLALSLNKTEKEAHALQQKIFKASPEVKDLIYQIINKARTKKYIKNWLGRVYRFPKTFLCYKAPNTLIQGGAGDVVKKAMNDVHSFLNDYDSRLILNVHDELVFEVKDEEDSIIPKIKEIMETTYPHKRLPLTCGVDYSNKSLADKQAYS